MEECIKILYTCLKTCWALQRLVGCTSVSLEDGSTTTTTTKIIGMLTILKIILKCFAAGEKKSHVQLFTFEKMYVPTFTP